MNASFSLRADRAALLAAVTAAGRAVERRNTIPVLGFVKIEAAADGGAVTGTNLDLEIRAEFEAEGAGSICLPAARLRDMLRAMTAERVDLALGSDGKVRLAAPDVEVSFLPMPAADFPDLKAGERVWWADLPKGVVAFTIGGAALSVRTDETRYFLNGVCLEAGDGAFRATATDGHWLVTRSSNLVGGVAGLPPIILPTVGVKAAQAIVGRTEAAVAALGSGGNASVIEIVADRTRIRCKAIDGAFPDWRRVVPKDPPVAIDVDVGALRRGLALAKANSGERGRALKISGADGGISISSRNPDDGDARIRVGCTGRGLLPDIGFNAALLDGLVGAVERMGSRTVRLEITDPGAPMKILPDAAIGGALAVLMPMRV